MIRLSKEIWHYLLNHNMAITAEYLPSVLKTVADRESRKKNQTLQSGFFIPKFFKRFLNYQVLRQTCICFLPMPPTTPIYSLASRSLQSRDRCNDTKLEHRSSLCIFPFSMISRVLLKIKQECVPLLILIAPVWSTQPWYPELLNLCVREPVLLPQGQEILKSPKILSTH